jgi:methionyl-tRNA formyltransferase
MHYHNFIREIKSESETMRILYFGDPRGILEINRSLAEKGLAKDAIQYCGIVHGRKGGPGYFKMLKEIPQDIPRWIKPDLQNEEIYEKLKALKPDLLVSCFYPRAIPKKVLDLAIGFNVHPSDLPEWRGPDPAYWIVRTGQSQSAITVHLLSEGLDEGDIVAKQKVEVKAKETGCALAIRLEAMCSVFLGQVVVDYLQNPKITPTPQKGKTTWAPLIDPNDVEIDWTADALEVDRLVRACSPEPGAFTGIAGELAVVFSGCVVKNEKFDHFPAGSPFLFEGRYHIKCGVDSYRINWLKIGRKRVSGKKLAELMG